MTAIPSMSTFLEVESETIWNDSYTYYCHVSWEWQQNYLKWQLYLLWPYFFRRSAKLPEMTAIPIMAICLEADSETTWNDSFTYYGYNSEATWNDSSKNYGHISWVRQRKYLKWQLYLLRLCFLRKPSRLLEMTAIPFMALFLEEASETTWNDS